MHVIINTILLDAKLDCSFLNRVEPQKDFGILQMVSKASSGDAKQW